MGTGQASEQGKAVTYQVTSDGVVVAEFSNGHDATLYATRYFSTRDARGKVVTVKRCEN